MIDERKSTSRWHACLKWMWGCICSPKVWKGLVWAARAAYWIWQIWQKFKDDLWFFYFLISGSHAKRRPPASASLSRHVPDRIGGQIGNLQVLPE